MEYKKSFSKNKKKAYLNLKWQCPNALNKGLSSVQENLLKIMLFLKLLEVLYPLVIFV